jgi:DnaJ family protein C protein 28
MDEFSHNIDEQIRRAIARGEFENLPGKGKPLELSENPHEDPGWRLAFRMLQSSGYTLPWIEKRRTIENEIEAARADLERSWLWQQSALAERQPREFIEAEWQRAMALFRRRITDLNRQIFSYNLEVPASQFQRLPLNADQEIEKIATALD